MNVEFLHTKLPLRARYGVAIVLYLLAFLLQAPIIRVGILPIIRLAGLGLLLASLWFLKVENFSNKPKKNNASAANAEEGNWMPVPMAELDRLQDTVRITKKVKIPLIYRSSFTAVATFLSVFLLFPLTIVAIIFTDASFIGFFIGIDLYLLFIPFLWYARVEKWLPAVSESIDAFGPVLGAKLPKPMQLSPLLYYVGEEPRDIRLMLVPGSDARQDIRDELVGAQFQITYNKGPKGSVPYMYVVFITKGMGRIWESLSMLQFARYITEPGSSTEGDVVYGTVVLRLDTKSRSDGYHTKESDVQALLKMTVSALEKL